MFVPLLVAAYVSKHLNSSGEINRNDADIIAFAYHDDGAAHEHYWPTLFHIPYWEQQALNEVEQKPFVEVRPYINWANDVMSDLSGKLDAVNDDILELNEHKERKAAAKAHADELPGKKHGGWAEKAGKIVALYRAGKHIEMEELIAEQERTSFVFASIFQKASRRVAGEE